MQERPCGIGGAPAKAHYKFCTSSCHAAHALHLSAVHNVGPLCCGSADGKLLAALAGGATAGDRQLLAWDWGAGRVVAAVACEASARALSAMPEPGAGGSAVWAVRGAQELRLWALELPQGWRARGMLARVRCRAGVPCRCFKQKRCFKGAGGPLNCMLKALRGEIWRCPHAWPPGMLWPMAAAHRCAAWCTALLQTALSEDAS